MEGSGTPASNASKSRPEPAPWAVRKMAQSARLVRPSKLRSPSVVRLVKSPTKNIVHPPLGEPMVDEESNIVRGSRPRAGAIDDAVAVDVAGDETHVRQGEGDVIVIDGQADGTIVGAAAGDGAGHGQLQIIQLTRKEIGRRRRCRRRRRCFGWAPA